MKKIYDGNPRDTNTDTSSHQKEREILDSLHAITSSLAREINNPLGGALLYTEAMAGKKLAGHLKKDLKIVHDEINRATQMVTSLLLLYTNNLPLTKIINIRDIIENILSDRQYIHDINNIHVATDINSEPMHINAAEDQIEHALTCIIQNAEESIMSSSDYRCIEISARKINQWIQLIIADNGSGIDTDKIDRIFHPFYTTREVYGKARGLGLTASRNIITLHGGEIRAENNSQGGASLIIELPSIEPIN